MARIPITLFSTTPIRFFTKYFYATTNGGTQNIFDKTNTSAPITSKYYEDYDAINTLINPLKTENVLRPDGNDLLVPLGGMLVVPDTPPTGKWPLVMIGHGNAFGYFEMDDELTKPVLDGDGNVVTKGRWKFTRFDNNEVNSYAGYAAFQDHLASQGIASFSFNLNIVNSIESSEEKDFDRLKVDVNQRILLFFLHLKLLKILAGDSLTIPTSGDEFPIKFFDGSNLVNLTDALTNTTSPDNFIMMLKDLLTNNIDFSKLGIMGHSRGADMVTRIPAYFYRSGTINGPTFDVNTEVNRRIRILSEQLSKPEQDTLKIIFALEPVATKNDIANKHGYVINNGLTLYMVGVGTHDEDVSLDPVRIYEYPQCPKIMIAVNGASHKRFNSVWYDIEKKKKPEKNPLEQPKVKLNLLKFEKQQAILKKVYGPCFIATLLDRPALLLDIILKKLDIDLPDAIDFQMAWKFGLALNLLNSPGSPEKVLKTSSFKFEQKDLEVYYIEKNNEGNAVIKVPISGTGVNLNNFTHFSFRFAKGFTLSSQPERIEEKNFTIHCFENDTPIGKIITGADIDTVELKALQAFDEAKKVNTKPEFTYSILLQTMEIALSSFSRTDLNRVNRIEITVIPDETKPPPNSDSKIILGSLGGAILGAFVGSLGAAITLAIINDDDAKRESNKWMAVSGGVGAAVGGLAGFFKFLPDDNAFVFEDFLLTKRP